MAFGAILVVESARFLTHDWIETLYLTPAFHPTYLWLDWLKPWPGNGLYWHFAVLCCLATMITVGLFTRFAIGAFLVGFGYVFLLDQGAYLNQYYLVLIFLFILCLVPSERGLSLDAYLRRTDLPATVPAWSLLLIRLEMEIVLIHSGLVKLNPDWLQGQPLEIWLVARSSWPLLGSLPEPVTSLAASWSVVALHLVGAPLLMWRRTRVAVFAFYVIFHLANATIFTIGLFSWLTLLGTLMFFDADWPREVWRRLGATTVKPDITIQRGQVAHPALLTLVALFLLAQVLIPLRHWLYPGNVAWTAEGRNFAWRMKLHERPGSAEFEVYDPASGRRWQVNPASHLSARSTVMLPGEPDLILQYAQYLSRLWAVDHGIEAVEVRAHVSLSLNGRPASTLVDPSVDLARERRHLGHYDWILPAPDTPLQR